MQSMSLVKPPNYRYILRIRVDATSYEDATQRILAWSAASEGSYVCAANVHMAMEAYDSPKFANVVNGADLVTPDGMPLVWTLRLFGIHHASRVYGPTLMLHVCEAAARNNVPVGLYGGTQASLTDFMTFLQRRFEGIQVVCQIAPPFRPTTIEEEATYKQQIISSGARILFVGIGCPKQEHWMASQTGHLPIVMIGVGAAFDFHSGRIKQAPLWMQKGGLEWLFRLCQEPRRLWKRYVYHNPRFIILLLYQWVTNGLYWKVFNSNSPDSF